MTSPSYVFWPGLIAIGAMYLFIFLVGVWASRGRNTSGTADQELTELMLAGRQLPLWLGLLTMCATWVGGGYINGTAEYTFARGLTWGLQAPIGYSLSLVLGGLFYARIMRANGYATLVDPLEQRFGTGSGFLLNLAAVFSEMIWSAAILVALGTTFGTVIGVSLSTSILVSAAVAIGYTLSGGLWSVAWTDAAQLVLIVVGLLVCLPFVWAVSGGTDAVIAHASPTPHLIGFGSSHEAISYADFSLLLILGGIPWNVYFQRVLATPNAKVAERLSIGAGGLCMLMAVPPLLMGLAARTIDWGALATGPAATGLGDATFILTTLGDAPSQVLPLLIRLAVPGWVSVVGLGAVAAAVMSSVDSSILSATSLLAWNGYKRTLRPDASASEMVWVMRCLILVIGTIAALIAVTVKSVAALWYLSGDVVYVLLFPALTLALFDSKANRTGCLAGLAVAAVLRLGGGEATLGLPAFLPYPNWDTTGIIAFPFRTLAMVAGLVVMVVVSRLTHRIDPPRPLRPLDTAGAC
jgi:high affinity choline transporter 7